MRPFYLIVFPLVLYLMTGLIYNNYAAWNGSMTGATTFTFVAPNTPLSALLDGDMMSFIFYLISPSSILTITGIYSLINIVGAVLLFIIGFGANISILGSGFGIGDQGAKLAQNLGFGLLVWGLANMFVGGWVTSLPTNFAALFAFILQTIFCLGIYWQTSSMM